MGSGIKLLGVARRNRRFANQARLDTSVPLLPYSEELRFLDLSQAQFAATASSVFTFSKTVQTASLGVSLSKLITGKS